jgi:hypothetical protein
MLQQGGLVAEVLSMRERRVYVSVASGGLYRPLVHRPPMMPLSAAPQVNLIQARSGQVRWTGAWTERRGAPGRQSVRCRDPKRAGA